MNSVFLKKKSSNFKKNKNDKLKKSNDQMNIDNYRVAPNNTEYHIISKLIFTRIIILKFMIRQLYHVKDICKHVKKINMFKMDVLNFVHTYRVPSLYAFYPTVSRIIILSLKWIRQL